MKSRIALVVVGELLFVASLPMVAIDDAMGGELLSAPGPPARSCCSETPLA